MFNLHEVFRIYQNLYTKVEQIFTVFGRIYLCSYFQDALEMALPQWAENIYPEPLHTLASYQCVFENYNDKLKRLNGGQLDISDIIFLLVV